MIDEYDEIRAQYQEQNMDDSVNPFQLMKNSFRQSPFKKLEETLSKLPQYRNMNDVKTISKFINQSPFLLKLSQRTSLDLVKHIIKNGKIYDFNKRQWICQKGTKLTFIFIILQGKVVTKNNDNSKVNPLYDSLPTRNFIPQQKKTRLIRRASLMQPQLHSLQSPQPKKKKQKKKVNDAQFNTSEKIIENGILYGEQLLNDNNQWYSETLVCQTPVKILGIRRQDYLEVYNQFVKKKKSDQRKLFRTACISFQQVEDDNLNDIIKSSEIVKYKKNEFIFKQDEIAEHFYILIDGEVKITKIIQLFRQNPNTLYMDRNTIIPQSKLQKKLKSEMKKRSSLPYADLTSVYNYHPQIKLVQISVISSLSLFGEEEVLQNIPRQVNVKVLTQQATMYKLSYESLVTCLISSQNKNILSDFKKNLYENLTKKRILYRQNKLSEILEVQNKSNMKYFYINNNQQQTNKKTKKLNLNKLRQTISPRKAQTARKIPQFKQMYNPLYNKFNFTKMFLKQNQEEDSMAKSMTVYEKQIAELTHTSRDISDKVKQRQTIVRQLKKPKLSISIHDPLFNQQYLKRKNIQTTRQQLINRKINAYIRAKCQSSQEKQTNKTNISRK